MAKNKADLDFDNKAYLEKEKEIKKEERRLKRLFVNVEENKKNLVFSTIEDVAFLAVTMRELRRHIAIEGIDSMYKNGENQYGTKQSPKAQYYLQCSQKHTAAMKILMDCLPKTMEKAEPKDDGFDAFLGERDG